MNAQNMHCIFRIEAVDTGFILIDRTDPTPGSLFEVFGNDTIVQKISQSRLSAGKAFPGARQLLRDGVYAGASILV